MCDNCVVEHTIANGIWLSRGPGAQPEADLELGL